MLRRTFMLLLAAWWLAPTSAIAQPDRSPAASSSKDPEVARLQQDVRDLRQMLIQAMQVEQQHHDLLLKLMQSGESPAAARAAAAPVEPASVQSPTTRTGAVTGTVEVKGAPAGQPVFVFVENLRTAPARKRTTEITQTNKQFSPQVSAVQRGTAVSFPNVDRVAHNVFSMAKRNIFDLGIVKSGDPGSPVVLSEPGIVEVFCDIHSRMWAEVLVTPNPYFTRVTNGSFRLPNVPAGERVIAVWTAGATPVRRTIQLTGEGAKIDFTLTVSARAQHRNKAGQPYNSYGE